MKKILIVNNNMEIGGVQKSLYNLLWALDGRYDVTLCLFRAAGAYVDKLPSSVTVVESGGVFRYLGMGQRECVSLRDKLYRGFFAAVSRLFGRKWAIKLMLSCQPMLQEDYDCAIAYLHNGRKEVFYGGVQEYILRRVRAERKIAFLHCDYRKCGADHDANNRLMAEFDAIAACSDGCRRVFCEVLPELADRCVTVRNCHRFEEICALAAQEPLVYDERGINVVMVSRLAHEKGIERAVRAVASCAEKGIDVVLHLVGGGPMKGAILGLARQLDVEDSVLLYGEQENPYRYMKNADLFLMTSFHEAAPMVIEEACVLGVPVLTTKTTSSEEMITKRGAGWVCDNSQDALIESFVELLKEPWKLRETKASVCGLRMNNDEAVRQFERVIEG